MTAAGSGLLPILRTLLDRKAIAIDAAEPDAGLTAFHYACAARNADCAVELARRGCDMTLKNKYGMTGKETTEHEKHTAVLAGLRALVAEQLRATMAEVDKLCFAAQTGDCGKLRELLDGDGASLVNKRTEIMDLETGEKVRVTALIQAVHHGQWRIFGKGAATRISKPYIIGLLCYT